MTRLRPYDPNDQEPYIFEDICNACGAVVKQPAVPGIKVFGKCAACGEQFGVPPHEAI